MKRMLDFILIKEYLLGIYYVFSIGLVLGIRDWKEKVFVFMEY